MSRTKVEDAVESASFCSAFLTNDNHYRKLSTMSRRAAVVEKFDDDTELPLPQRSLANTGTRGAILESLSDNEDDSDASETFPPRAGPASPSQPQFRSSRETDTEVKDPTYKKCVRFLAIPRRV